MKVSIVHDWDVHYEQELNWKDGLSAAIRELSKRHQIQFLVCGRIDTLLPHEYFDIHVSTDIARDIKAFKPDVILMWGDCTRPNALPCSQLGIPMALCFAGGSPEGHTNAYFDHFFVESEVYRERFEVMGKSVSTAFGTNTELFKPLPEQPKCFDVCFPATYAGWKRHHLYAQATEGLRSITTGYIIAAEDPIVGWVRKTGTFAMPHISAEALKTVYAASKSCCITSFWTGGSQRTVLEAMAMNIPLVVMQDSDKTTEYVREAGEGVITGIEPLEIRTGIEKAMTLTVNTRDYIMSKWSEYKYAEALEEGLCKLVS